MTLGILLVANDHHTVLNIHERIVNNILERNNINNETITTSEFLFIDSKKFLEKEFSFISLILNSNNNKLNKSSTLWHFYKKIFIYNQIYEIKLNPKWFIRTALYSCELHPTNYYSWNFIKTIYNWCQLNQNQEEEELTKFISNQVKDFCKKHTSDSAAWNCLADLSIYDKDSYDFTMFEFGEISGKKITLDKMQLNEDRVIQREELLTELKDFLKIIRDSKTTSIVPHLALRKLIKYYSHYEQNQDHTFLLKELNINEELKFETKLKEKNIIYEVKNGFFTINKDLSDDITLYQDLQRYINFKEDIKWIKKFCLYGRKSQMLSK